MTKGNKGAAIDRIRGLSTKFLNPYGSEARHYRAGITAAVAVLADHGCLGKPFALELMAAVRESGLCKVIPILPKAGGRG